MWLLPFLGNLCFLWSIRQAWDFYSTLRIDCIHIRWIQKNTGMHSHINIYISTHSQELFCPFSELLNHRHNSQKCLGYDSTIEFEIPNCLHCNSAGVLRHFLFSFLIMQENNMNEIKRFNKERRHDLVEMLKGFVSDQVKVLNFVAWFIFGWLFAVGTKLLI